MKGDHSSQLAFGISCAPGTLRGDVGEVRHVKCGPCSKRCMWEKSAGSAPWCLTVIQPSRLRKRQSPGGRSAPTRDEVSQAADAQFRGNVTCEWRISDAALKVA